MGRFIVPVRYCVLIFASVTIIAAHFFKTTFKTKRTTGLAHIASVKYQPVMGACEFVLV